MPAEGGSSVFRLVGQFEKYEGLTVNALEVIRDFGGDLARGEPVHDEDAVAAALDAIRSGMFEEGWIEKESRSFREEETRAAFTSGEQILFMRNWPYAFPLVRSDEEIGDHVGVERLPWRSVLGGHNLAVSSRSKRPYTAHRFIEFLVSKDIQRMLFIDGGYAPVLEKTYEDPDAPPHASKILEAVRDAEPRPATPYYDRVGEVIQTHIDDFLAGDLSASAAVKKLGEELEKALDGA